LLEAKLEKQKQLVEEANRKYEQRERDREKAEKAREE